VASSKKGFGLFGKDVAQGRITPAGRLMLDQVFLAQTFDFDGEIAHEKKQKSRKQKIEIKTGKAEIWKAESRNAQKHFAVTGKQISTFTFMISFFVFKISDFYFLLSVFVFGFVDHGGENGHQFGGFRCQRLRERGIHSAFLAQQFQPQGRLVGFLQSPTQFGDEFVIRPGARCFAGLGGH
jgi:hypothetical protein